jgi:hypothetical protein
LARIIVCANGVYNRPETALDAAAKILASADGPMTTKELIEAMAARGLWKSPNGRTPERTLNSAISREVAKKARAARFKEGTKGKFALRRSER